MSKPAGMSVYGFSPAQRVVEQYSRWHKGALSLSVRTTRLPVVRVEQNVYSVQCTDASWFPQLVIHVSPVGVVFEHPLTSSSSSSRKRESLDGRAMPRPLGGGRRHLLPLGRGTGASCGRASGHHQREPLSSKRPRRRRLRDVLVVMRKSEPRPREIQSPPRMGMCSSRTKSAGSSSCLSLTLDRMGWPVSASVVPGGG